MTLLTALLINATVSSWEMTWWFDILTFDIFLLDRSIHTYLSTQIYRVADWGEFLALSFEGSDISATQKTDATSPYRPLHASKS